jgi:hypothetical protein
MTNVFVHELLNFAVSVIAVNLAMGVVDYTSIHVARQIIWQIEIHSVSYWPGGHPQQNPR